MGLATRNNMKIFLRKYGAAMLTASQNNPIYFSLLLSQASLESGYGTSNIAKTKYNFFGVYDGSNYKTFSSPVDAFNYQLKLLTTGIYLQNGVPVANTPYEQIKRIANAGYYSMNNDETLPKSLTGSAIWNKPKSKWIGIRFTPQQSAAWYIKNLSEFIDDALAVMPLGLVTSTNYISSINRLNTINPTV